MSVKEVKAWMDSQGRLHTEKELAERQDLEDKLLEILLPKYDPSLGTEWHFNSAIRIAVQVILKHPGIYVSVLPNTSNPEKG